jgi:hypothetical protein
MPRPTTIADRVALVEALYLDRNRGLSNTDVAIVFNTPSKIIAQLRKQREIAELPAPLLRSSKGVVSRKIVFIKLALWLVIALLLFVAFSSSSNAVRLICSAAAFGTLVTVLSKVFEDLRVARMRWLRTKPLLTALLAPHDAAQLQSALSIIHARNEYRTSLTTFDRRRAMDQLVPRSAVACSTPVIVSAPLLACIASHKLSAVWFILFIIAAIIHSSLRRSSRLIDKRRNAKCCQDCGFDCSLVPQHPTLASLTDSLGPPLCPECGMHWPLVPPPTPEEVLSAP